MKTDYRDVLRFWFREIKQEQWWGKDSGFDALIKRRFGTLHEAACQNELFEWRCEPEGRLAEIIVLDQFSRNIHRDCPQAFAADAQALALAQEAVALGIHKGLGMPRIAFLLMPYMHSESIFVHEQAIILFEKFAPANLEFELKHKRIIDRFGRYPHRNDILGRASSAEELAFLEEPGSSF